MVSMMKARKNEELSMTMKERFDEEAGKYSYVLSVPEEAQGIDFVCERREGTVGFLD